MSDTLERLESVRKWVSEGIPVTLAQPGGVFLLGVESESILNTLDLIEGGILNLEAEVAAGTAHSQGQEPS